MGRYFQHADWPTVNFELTAAAALVPQSLLPFAASGGPYLLTVKALLRNGTAGSGNFTLDLLLDGLALPRLNYQVRLGGGIFDTVVFTALVEIEPGSHTLELQATGLAAAGDQIDANTGVITALELNPQEASDRID